MMNQMASKMKNYFVNENNIKIENEVYENKLEGKPHNTPGAKSVILPLLSKSPKSIKSPKSNFKDMNFGKEEHTVKIVPMRSKSFFIKIQRGMKIHLHHQKLKNMGIVEEEIRSHILSMLLV